MINEWATDWISNNAPTTNFHIFLPALHVIHSSPAYVLRCSLTQQLVFTILQILPFFIVTLRLDCSQVKFCCRITSVWWCIQRPWTDDADVFAYSSLRINTKAPAVFAGVKKIISMLVCQMVIAGKTLSNNPRVYVREENRKRNAFVWFGCMGN